MVSRAVADQSLSLVRCHVASQNFVVDMNRVRRIQRADRLRRQPGADGRIGVLPGTDADLPVYSLAQLLGWPDAALAGVRPILVLDTQPQAGGLLADGVSQVIRVDPKAIRSLPAQLADSGRGCLAGVVHHENELLLLLAPDRLVPGAMPAAPELAGSSAEDANPLLGPPPRADAERQLAVFTTVHAARRTRPLAFGLSITQVLEVLGKPRLVPVPRAADFVLGLTYWRERAVAVLDLSRCLGLGSSDSAQCSRLVIARASVLDPPIGFVVRSSVRVLRLPLPHQPSELALAANTRAIRAAVELRKETLILPDLRTVGESRLGSRT